MRREYAQDTYLETAGPWQVFIGARALCPDGKVRKVKRIGQVGDTFFSIPAAISLKRKTVTGFLTIQTIAGFEVPTDDDPAIVKFFPVQYGKNANLF